MVHVRFDPSISINDYQSGYGGAYFKGISPYQRGYGYQHGAGLGDVLRGVWRFLLPVIKSPAMKEIGQSVGKEMLSSGSNILSKVASGETLKSAVLEEGKNAAESLLEKGIEKVTTAANRKRSAAAYKRTEKKGCNHSVSKGDFNTTK
ncbi:MAG TPA: hypothetical protein VFV08_02045, partial [Puia sp.]|nr:hypothetical protein [Puia sp.]